MPCGFATDRWGENLGAPWMLPPQSVKPAPDLSCAEGVPSPQDCREPNHVYLETTRGDATHAARLKPGADKSGNKISPRRAEVLAPPIRGTSAPHRQIAHSPKDSPPALLALVRYSNFGRYSVFLISFRSVWSLAWMFRLRRNNTRTLACHRPGRSRVR